MPRTVEWNIESSDSSKEWVISCIIDNDTHVRRVTKKEPTSDGGDGGWYYRGSKLLVQNCGNYSALQYGIKELCQELDIPYN